jgi:protocatechuate 3,4-dioxygenase beta subunit
VALPEEEREGSPSRAASADARGLRGSVVDRVGTPIAGARVTLAKDAGFPLDLDVTREFGWLGRERTESDPAGAFRFSAVAPGALRLGVRAAGFAPHESAAQSVPGIETALDPIVLARGAILTGRVVDPAGRGVAAARILPADPESSSMFLGGEREPAAVTAGDGSFRIDVLACGAWRFRVRSEEHPDLVVSGTADEPVEQSGLRWQLEAGASIAGTVTGVPEGERGALEVRATRAGNEDFDEHFLAFGGGRTVPVAASGAFEVRGLRPGESYSLHARAAQRAEGSFWERSRSSAVQARAGELGLVIPYQPEAAITFRVLDARTRAPLERFEVQSGTDWTSPLLDEDGRPRRLFPNGEARVGGLRPRSEHERVQLRVVATGYSEYSRADVAVRAGQELDLGAITLEPVPTVRVRVRDARGAPVAEAAVRLQRNAGEGRFEVRHSISVDDDEGVEAVEFGEGRSARTDAEGLAVLTSFGGESASLTVRAEGYAPFRLAELQLPAAESVEQEVRLTAGGEVLVRVLDAQGAALPGARVEHRSASEGLEEGVFVLGSGGRGEVADARGEVLYSNLAPGPHSFRIGDGPGGGATFAMASDIVIHGLEADDGADWSQIQVGEGERAELTLRAAPRGSLDGKVREAGKVLAGATLRIEPEEAEAGDRPRMMMPGMDEGPRAKSDGDGRYRFEDVKAGRHSLVVEHPSRRMSTSFPLELREGENSFDVELPVSVLSGRVRDEQGKGIPGVRVSAERKSGGRESVAFRMVMLADDGEGTAFESGAEGGPPAVTDGEGHYVLRGVASDADLVVKAEGDAVQPGESGVVRLAPNEVKEGVDLVLAAAGSIRVEAVLADGSPARFQLVQAEFLGASDAPPRPKFGFLQQGSTELKGLRPGRWKVNLRDAQGGPREADTGQDQEVEVAAGATATARFEVE